MLSRVPRRHEWLSATSLWCAAMGGCVAATGASWQGQTSPRFRDDEGVNMAAGNVCIVTGSATGIGAACAIELARRGWHTVINYTKSEAEAQQTARECEKHGGETLLVRADVSQDADCRRMADATLQKWGRSMASSITRGTTKRRVQSRQSGSVVGGRFPEDLFSECRRRVSDDPRRRARHAQQGRGSVVNISSAQASIAPALPLPTPLPRAR